MRSRNYVSWMLISLLTGCSIPGFPGAKPSPAANSYGTAAAPAAPTSWTQKITAPFTSKSLPKPASTPNLKSDPISLQFASGPPSAALYMSMAQLSDQGGHPDQARSLYQKALTLEPKNTECLLGLARLEDREGNLQTALQIYQQAVNENPDDAKPLNDLALCHARSGQLDTSLQLLDKAVQMSPDKELYRNNIAKVWIEKNRLDLAAKHLRAVYEPAVANYNMAVLLQQRGRSAEAVSYLNIALVENPQLDAAKTLLASLNGASAQQTVQQNYGSSHGIQVSMPATATQAAASNDDILPTPMFPPTQSSTAHYPSTGAQPMIPQPQNFPAETASVPVGNSPLSFPPVR